MMFKKLTASQIEKYQDNGFVFPIDAFSSKQANDYLKKLEMFEKRQNREVGKGFNFKPHLLFPWVDEVARHPAILDAVEDLIGPNIRLFHLTVWPKGSGDGAFIDWHQDATYFGLEPSIQVTAWVALSDAPVESGCMEMIPGSHRLGQLHHSENDSNKILLSRGQTVSVGLDQSNTVFMPVKAGQFSLHDTHTVHRSGPNMAAWRRLGLGFSYIPTHVRCTSRTRLTAALVRGQDSFNHFDDEVRPVEDYGVSERAFHEEAVRRFRASNDEQASNY